MPGTMRNGESGAHARPLVGLPPHTPFMGSNRSAINSRLQAVVLRFGVCHGVGWALKRSPCDGGDCAPHGYAQSPSSHPTADPSTPPPSPVAFRSWLRSNRCPLGAAPPAALFVGYRAEKCTPNNRPPTKTPSHSPYPLALPEGVLPHSAPLCATRSSRFATNCRLQAVVRHYGVCHGVVRGLKPTLCRVLGFLPHGYRNPKTLHPTAVPSTPPPSPVAFRSWLRSNRCLAHLLVRPSQALA